MPKKKAAGSASQTAATKSLVRGSDGKLYVYDETAKTLTQVDPLAKPDPTIQAALDTAEGALTDHFNNLGLASLASGVRIKLIQL
jgi:hypothetical protein